jgi:hypothetical protein
MPTRDQNTGCTIGDSFTLGINVLPYADGTQPDLTGASAVWSLSEGNYTGAAVLITKDEPPEIFINQLEDLSWQIVVELEPADTISIPRGMYYHQCRVTLAGGLVSHIDGGAFLLGHTSIP